ncbi:MAG: phosphatidate cytidylyltransferase [Ferruginibacter sp.]|nr:phosphatidate cytidylyltransferase [Ferruginibacter sp.]
MSLNKEVFKTRALTALVFVLVMLFGIFINGYTFALLFSIIMFGCLFEFAKIIKIIKPKGYRAFLIFALPYIIVPLIMFISLGINLDNDKINFKAFNNIVPVAILFSIWLNDTMQYLVGSFFGKTPFSKISPKKTWEGTIGGAILCVFVMGLFGYFVPAFNKLALQHWLTIAAICAVFGTLGDLLESKLKRLAGLKDSGTFMPGHGGFLDRFDSLLVAAPFVWLYVQVFVVKY